MNSRAGKCRGTWNVCPGEEAKIDGEKRTAKFCLCHQKKGIFGVWDRVLPGCGGAGESRWEFLTGTHLTGWDKALLSLSPAPQ